MASDGRKAGALPRPRLVLFDFDGVIADSEAIALEELAAEMTARGARTSYEDARARFLGMSTARHMEYITETSGVPCAPDFPDVWHGRLFSRYPGELAMVDGVVDTLDLLERLGIDYCLASGGSVERIHFALDCLGLMPRFDGRIFSAEMVARGKPAPDLFLHAAASREVSPHECLVVEDAPSGVTAAVAAGIPCVAFLGGTHLETVRDGHREMLTQGGAAMAVNSHAELQSLIGGF